jgi:coenzyme F420-0:L-glutamate ligase/coenzyme F420-1:gamma-L-glutamate ligase
VTDVQVVGLTGIPEITARSDLAAEIVQALRRQALQPDAADVLVVAQKVVSKAEGRSVDLRTVSPGAEALELAAAVAKDPRLVQVILSESRRVIRRAPGTLIVETRHGFICANAGVDHSNVDAPHHVLRLPLDPDASARRLREALRLALDVAPAVVISDSHGRAWRLGSVGVAIGAAGLEPLLDLRGRADRHGRPLVVSTAGRVDEIAAAAGLVMGEAAEGIPCALVRGVEWTPASPGAGAVGIQRPEERNLFR